MKFNAATTVPVRAPYRLDYTTQALRRLAGNAVDVVEGDTFYRAVETAGGKLYAIAVRQRDETTLELRAANVPAAEAVALAHRMLGTHVDLRDWYRRSARIPWLRSLARTFEGTKPPRYASAWEGCAHAIVFAQISIHAAAAIMRRVIERLGKRIELDGGIECVAFPPPARWLAADETLLREAGLSRNKVAHLRSVAAAFADGTLSDDALERLPTPEAAAKLVEVRGLGPWSAAVVLLRALGRLDVFPMRDSGVARTVLALAGGPVDLDGVLETLGPMRGMLYYHLLLGRLYEQGRLAVQPGPPQPRSKR